MGKAKDVLALLKEDVDPKIKKEFIDQLKDMQKVLPSIIKDVEGDNISSKVSGFVGQMVRTSDEDWYRHYFK